MRDQIAAQLGSSLAAGAVADGVNNDWWSEFTAQATGLGATFTPSIVGFASTLDTLSRVLDARYPPAALMWLLGGYLALWTFLSGGILDRYARQRPTRAHGFFSACGRLFFRLARLTAHRRRRLLAALHSTCTRGCSSTCCATSRAASAWSARRSSGGCSSTRVFGLVLLTINLVFDYARIRLVVEDRRSALGALRASLRFLWHHPLQRHGALRAQRRRLRPAARALVGGRAWRVRHGAGDVDRRLPPASCICWRGSPSSCTSSPRRPRSSSRSLAHASYTAAPAPAWPESPAAELIARW